MEALEGDVFATSWWPIFACCENLRHDPKLFYQKHGSLIQTHIYRGYCLKSNAVGSKQKQNQKKKIQEKSDQKRKDTIKQLAYHASKLIKKYQKINQITKQRIKISISEGKQDVKRFQSKTTRDTIEHTYQTPLRLLGKFGKEQFKKTKRNLGTNLIRQ